MHACMHALQKLLGHINLTWVISVALTSSHMRINKILHDKKSP